MVESTATPYQALTEGGVELNEVNQEMDLESQAVFVYDWSEDEESKGEKSSLLAEFRQQNAPNGKRPAVNVRDQPAFHEQNISFFERSFDCCIPRTSSTRLNPLEVSKLII